MNTWSLLHAQEDKYDVASARTLKARSQAFVEVGNQPSMGAVTTFHGMHPAYLRLVCPHAQVIRGVDGIKLNSMKK
jgi:hypothetical protein